MEFGSPVCIRQFVPSDLVPLLQMIQETIETSYRDVYPVRAIQFFSRFHSKTAIEERSRSGEVLVLEQDGRILATGSLRGNEISGVFVSPSAQRLGYGRAVMNELEMKAKAQGITEIELSISLPSRRFYENMGYEVLERKSIDMGEGQSLAYWPARKKL